MAEVHAASGHSPLHALELGFWASDPCFTVTLRDAPVAMFGTAEIPGQPGFGAPWLLASPELFERKLQFMRESRHWIAQLWKDYNCLTNCVDERNQKHIEWLEAVGFKFVARYPDYGFEKLPFLQFVMWRNQIV